MREVSAPPVSAGAVVEQAFIEGVNARRTIAESAAPPPLSLWIEDAVRVCSIDGRSSLVRCSPLSSLRNVAPPAWKKPPGLQKKFPSRAHSRNGTGFIRHSRSRNTLQRPLVLSAPRMKRLSFCYRFFLFRLSLLNTHQSGPRTWRDHTVEAFSRMGEPNASNPALVKRLRFLYSFQSDPKRSRNHSRRAAGYQAAVGISRKRGARSANGLVFISE